MPLGRQGSPSPENPLAHLDGLNVKTDRRRNRRALTVDELRGLLDAACRGPECYGMDGPERGLLYWLAVESGLRSNELRSLTRASFALDAEPPTVTVDAAYSANTAGKTRWPCVLPWPQPCGTSWPPSCPMPGLSDANGPQGSRGHVSKPTWKPRASPGATPRALWSISTPCGTRSSRTLRTLGFIRRRHRLLARHCSITLTMDRYSHTLREQEAEALGVLPDLAPSSREAVRKTGTDDAPVLASCLALSGGPKGALVDSDGLSDEERVQCENTGKTVISVVSSKCRRGGRAADCTGLENRRRRKTFASSNLAPSACEAKGYDDSKGVFFSPRSGNCYANCYVSSFIASCSESSTLA